LFWKPFWRCLLALRCNNLLPDMPNKHGSFFKYRFEAPVLTTRHHHPNG
jgi:hypothetical protein